MNLKSIFFWSSLLTLPTLFFLPKKKRTGGVVEPGPTTQTSDGEVVVTEPSAPPEPFDPGE